MVQLVIAAFAMGLLGSFHCIGMCGPLALSLPLSNDDFWSKFSGALTYNAGRIVTYSVLGVLFGTVGQTAGLFGYQQWLSVLLGILIIFFIILPKKITAFKKNNFLLLFFEKIRAVLGQLFFKKNYASLFSIGLLNGLLPCGLVYMAAAGAVATGSIFNSMIFMAFFGVGTLPVMWSVAFFGNYMSIGTRQKIRRLYPYMMTLMACLLILRGLGLGIPYMSPEMNVKEKIVQGCCAKPG
jgi:uncharacterized protein